MPNFQVLDAYGSVITIESSVIGTANRQVVAATTGNSSVTLLGGTNVLGSVAALQGTSPWNIAGSVATTLQTGTAVIGSVATLQGTNPWRTLGSVSGTIDASLIGMLPAGTQVLGSVAALQGTNPWVTTFSNSSILATQQGTRTTSVVNSIPSSLLTGVHGHRNDAVASYLGADLSWRPIATDSAGRILARPFAPEESRIEGYVALTSTSLTTLVAAAGAGLRNYITDLWFANTGATTTLVTLSDSAASILGYTIAPTVSGSNLPGLVTPIRTGANASFNIQAGSNTSTLYATVKGFRAP